MMPPCQWRHARTLKLSGRKVTCSLATSLIIYLLMAPLHVMSLQRGWRSWRGWRGRRVLRGWRGWQGWGSWRGRWDLSGFSHDRTRHMTAWSGLPFWEVLADETAFLKDQSWKFSLTIYAYHYLCSINSWIYQIVIRWSSICPWNIHFIILSEYSVEDRRRQWDEALLRQWSCK